MPAVRLVIFLLLAVLSWSAPNASGEEVYKWVDKQGAVHFSDSAAGKQNSPSEASASAPGWAKRYQYLIKTAVAEYENPARTSSDELRVCSEAVRVLKRGMSLQGKDEEFLDTVESALKNCKKVLLQNGQTKMSCNSGEAFSLLDKARAIKGIASRPANRPLKDRLDELEDDLPTAKPGRR